MKPILSYGCSTFCCMDMPLSEALAFVRTKTDRIEIISEGLHDLFRYHEACASVDARYSVHAPLSDINLASTNDRIRTAGLAVIDDLCSICDAIRAETLVVHPGYFPWENMFGISYAALMHSLDDIAVLQKKHEVRIGIENMGSWECLHFRQPDLLPELERRDIGFVLDIGHARLNHALCMFAGKSRPCHIHLHDNGGTNDDHAACGSGTIDFARLLPLLPASASRIIECMDPRAYEKSVAYLLQAEAAICRGT
ncbi:Xylose isomerase domain protein TIM barrel [Methanoregula boonei 6A8]|uniref:Xylose isomerase domain protein TIM barrel n=1 Tax=Methanoregula boonei (strain DSM 21154 / JCM 14090 / 6A8) TaxID=456442 RepID=A7I6Z5_METB6|nr:sugar phosphate isomerase/epimerase family protein [Methanoregula boonei]ABS55506.1 Xylose isomerase domain protein TIM barrel [Methanoregula boonei 6A8]